MDQLTAVALDRALAGAYDEVRARTETYSAFLSSEDQAIQSMEDASPAKWHRAHTTWFFEQFIVRSREPHQTAFDDDFNYLFNSYYESLGERHPRATRGLVTRPTSSEVAAYRAHVDQMMRSLLRDPEPDPELARLVRLGLAHEEQHQELLLTDMMHGFAQNPLAWGRRPIAVLPGWSEPTQPPGTPRMLEFEGGLVEIGTPAGCPFAFDNESPRHRVFLQPYAVSSDLVRNRDWIDFVADGGYRRPELWMADGWDCARRAGWSAPLYWRDQSIQMGLGGVAPLDPEAPVRHVSWYEADAFARWSGMRLPSEQELEVASPALPAFHGHVWQWTASPYVAYPGFRPPDGAIGEYNGKFMINQMILRGSSFATSPGHSRAGYRNFFHPDKRWQVTGLRLAEDR